MAKYSQGTKYGKIMIQVKKEKSNALVLRVCGHSFMHIYLTARDLL